MDNNNWKELADDLILLEQLKERFSNIGCTTEQAFQLATYLYMKPDQPIIIKTKIISDNNINR